jgi:hypothetical protein
MNKERAQRSEQPITPFRGPRGEMKKAKEVEGVEAWQLQAAFH